MPPRKKQKALSASDRYREEQLRVTERELNALRHDLRRLPEDEVRALLASRYGDELDQDRLARCVADIINGREVRLTSPARR